MTAPDSGLLHNPAFDGDPPWVFTGDAGAVVLPYDGYTTIFGGTAARLSSFASTLGGLKQTFYVRGDQAGGYYLRALAYGNSAWSSGGYLPVRATLDGVVATSNFFGYDMPDVGGGSLGQGVGLIAANFGAVGGDGYIYLAPGWHRIQIDALADDAWSDARTAIFYQDMDFVGGPAHAGYSIPGALPPQGGVRVTVAQAGGGPNKLAWSHDSATFEVASDDNVVLRTPLAVLTSPPATLVGQDPATGLPAYCPGPVVPVTVPITPVPPDTGSTNSTAQCGAAVAMATYLEQYYHNIASVIGSLETGFASWLLSAVIDLVIEALTDGVGTGWLVLNQAAIKGFASWLIINVVGGGSDWSALTTTQNNGILQACYCALGPVSGNIALTDAIIENWASRLAAMSLGFDAPQAFTMPALIGLVSTESWQRIAYQGSATPSSVCSGFTCT